MAKKGYRDYVLSALPGTRQEIRAKTGLAEMTVHRWTKLLHEAGEIHISGWIRPPKGQFTAIYADGAGKDAPCRLRHLSLSETSERYRRKLKAEGRWIEHKMRLAAAERAKRQVARAKEKPNTWLGALL